MKRWIDRHRETLIPALAGVFSLFVFGLALGAAGYPLIIPLLLLFLWLHLYFFKRARTRLMLNLSLLLALLVFTTHVFRSYPEVSFYYVPIASFAMLTMLLFNDLQITFLMAFISSTIVTLMTGETLSFMLTFFLGGLTGAYAVKDARTRGRLLTAGAYVSLMQILCHLLLNPIVNKIVFYHTIKPLLFNGIVCIAVVAFTLKIFETIFGEITNFSLLELSDASNQKLLKRMIVEAPGSYHHSLIVSNLSEAAADAVGAHGLLARVGSYYHDIGKLIKPEYFTENQLMAGNKHDDLEPSMSRLVILNHVKEGIELGKKYGLNQKIIDFIPQHHGTALIFYFYQRALEEAGGEKIDEMNYRYPGPKPQSRETAIVLLADSVEGATRALDEHSPTKIQEVVRKVINNKFIDGQLDECNLTLKDIDVIAGTFTRVLTAMYHGRVKYPEKKTNTNGHGHQHKKPSDEGPHPSSQN